MKELSGARIVETPESRRRGIIQSPSPDFTSDQGQSASAGHSGQGVVLAGQSRVPVVWSRPSVVRYNARVQAPECRRSLGEPRASATRGRRPVNREAAEPLQVRRLSRFRGQCGDVIPEGSRHG